MPIILEALIGFLLTPHTVEITNTYHPRVFAVAEAADTPPHKEKSLREAVLEMAQDEGVDWQLVDNIVSCESQWDPNAVNERTGDYGLWQVNERYWPDIAHKNPIEQSQWAIQRIKDGYSHQWVCANCVLYIRAYYYPDLPPMEDIQPNSYGYEGAVVIFDYDGVKHLAYLAELREEGFLVKEANYTKGKIGERIVDYNDPKIVGFWAQTPP